jgi:hypothetical protein
MVCSLQHSPGRLTVRSAMAYGGPVTAREFLSGGGLLAFKRANHWRVGRVELEGWIRRRMEARGRA